MIELKVEDPRDEALWIALMELSEKSGAWTLIGARMVELLAAEHATRMTRLSLDADALADARARPNAVRGLSQILVESGFELQDLSYFGEGHVFRRGDVEIDVLAPEGLGARSEAARTTVPPAHTVEVPGGTQALRRTESVEVGVNGHHGRIRRPNLLGGILVKARAVGVDDVPDNQRSDLALLLSLVEDPDSLASDLKGTERGWLKDRAEMNDPDAACWQGLAAPARQRGLAALRILAGLGG